MQNKLIFVQSTRPALTTKPTSTAGTDTNNCTNNSTNQNHCQMSSAHVNNTSKSDRKCSESVRIHRADESDSEIDTLLADYALSTAENIARKNRHKTVNMGGSIETLVLKSMLKQNATSENTDNDNANNGAAKRVQLASPEDMLSPSTSDDLFVKITRL